MTKEIINLVTDEKTIIGYTSLKEAQKLIKQNKAIKLSDNKIKIDLKEISNLSVEVKERKIKKISIPKYSLSEELISAISHGLGALFSILALILCIIKSAINENVYGVVSSCIYGSMSIILYSMSTLYHSLKVNDAKRVFRIIDHCSIYLLIAGTYTPYSLVALRSVNALLGWSVFGVVWGCAILGIIFTAIDMNKFKIPGMILYLVMGWMIIFTFKDLMQAVAISGIYLMIAAGILYSIGAILYGVGKKIKYMHSIFHIFVLAASICFFFSILMYVI